LNGPLTLADMRAYGVHSVTYDCLCKPPIDEMNIDHLPGHITVPDVRKYIRCSGCGKHPLRTMPLWKEREGVVGKPDTRP
jgi:hypothetical protein